MKLYECVFTFFMGFFLYGLVEILLRGYTHWTMTLTGGILLTVLYVTDLTSRLSLPVSCLAGALIITSAELPIGIIDNIIMDWNVWDYSDMPLNLMGQICLPFSCFWSILCLPAFGVCSGIRSIFRQNPSCASLRTVST